jgi:hypothetical protein
MPGGQGGDPTQADRPYQGCPTGERAVASRPACASGGHRRGNGPILCVFAHKDADCVEPGHNAVAEAIESALAAALRRAGVAGCSVHAVVPAWEMENWLLLWPDVLGDHVSSWRTPAAYRSRNLGVVADGKAVLRAAVRPLGAKASRAREYHESDAPPIAREVRRRGLVTKPAGTSASYARFRASIESCCATV